MTASSCWWMTSMRSRAFVGAGLETVDHRIEGFAAIPFDIVSGTRTGARQLDLSERVNT